MDVFYSLLLIITSTIVADSAVAGERGNLHNLALAGVTRSQGCPFPFPAGLPRFQLDPPATYYPIGDPGVQEVLLLEIAGDNTDRSVSTFLKMGCPRRDILYKNNTDAYYHLTAFGDKSSLLKCYFPNPSVAELVCPSLDGIKSKDYSEAITLTDNDTFIVSVRCYPSLRLFSWIAQSNLPTLSGEAIREIRQHVTGLGFNWNKAKPIGYERCPTCRSTY